MNPITVAVKGKGYLNFLRRGVRIARRYGMTPGKLDRALGRFAAVLHQFDCSASFPITSVTLSRNPEVIRKYQAQGIEFAVHGYRHVDHSRLSRVDQRTQLGLARRSFERSGIPVVGFRGPYLHWNSDTLAALQQQGFVYDSSQGLAWDVVDGHGTAAYRHVLGFYGALPARDYPSLPSLTGTLVRIPYSLPDDEALIERLDFKAPNDSNMLWLAILRRTHELGELFTLGLHPERIRLCLEPLTAVLAEARSLTPEVWIARLDEIAAWWRTRTEAVVEVTDVADSRLRMTVTGPRGTTVLARFVEVDAPTIPWGGSYCQVEAKTFTLGSSLRPFVGLSPATSTKVADFLRQQGYIVEISEESHRYTCYIHQAEFVAEHKRPLLAQIEKAECSLVRLGRWPDGARSALAITGDIDALTLWDYGLRFFER